MTGPLHARRAELSNLMDQIDRAGGDRPRGYAGQIAGGREVEAVAPAGPPVYGGPQRDAIAAVVDQVTRDICEKIGALRKLLDDIERAALQSAAASKNSLNEHLSVCVKINDEILHMQDVVADLNARDT